MLMYVTLGLCVHKYNWMSVCSMMYIYPVTFLNFSVCFISCVSSGYHHQGQGYVHYSSVCLCLSGDVYAISMLFSLRDTVDSGNRSRREHCSKENFYFYCPL